MIRHEVTGTLQTVTALRVGGWGSSAQADLLVARDGLGRIMIPGTSLAGALRAWLGTVTAPGGGRLYGPAALGKVFGDLTPHSDGGEVCRIRIDDAVAVGDASIEIRDGVGIDRITGAAAANVLYQHEVIPPGTRFPVRFVAEQVPGDPERVNEALNLLVGALTEGRVEIGAGRTRGLGVIRLTDVRRIRVDLTNRTEVLGWLCGRELPAVTPAPGDSGAPASDGRLGIEVVWSPVNPVMVKASTLNEPEPAGDGVADRDHAVDTVPLRTTAPAPDGQARLLLPGSSIKGVIRSHAERIMRTLLGIHELPEQWLDQVNDSRLTPVGALFGFAGDHSVRGAASAADDSAGPAGKEHTAAPDDRGREGRRGALSVHDCHGTATAERVVTHVAVDRWTGGAADNLLFSVQEPAAADWQPMKMSLDTRRVNQGEGADGASALALLLLVLRDLADGWLAMGFGGTRGRGTVSVSRITFTGSELPQPWTDLCGRTLAEVISDPPEAVNRAFASWREAVGS